MFTALLRWFVRGLFARTYEGPAKLELFGHGHDVGWVRLSGSTVEILSIDGKTSVLNASAVFRMTPISFEELTRASVNEQTIRKGVRDEALRFERSMRDHAASLGKRICGLRDALDAINTKLILVVPETPTIVAKTAEQQLVTDAASIATKALQADIEADDDDRIPF